MVLHDNNVTIFSEFKVRIVILHSKHKTIIDKTLQIFSKFKQIFANIIKMLNSVKSKSNMKIGNYVLKEITINYHNKK